MIFLTCAGVYSHRATVFYRATLGKEESDDVVTDGPEEVIGYKWRNATKLT